MRIFFTIEYDKFIPNGKNVITRDSSILFEPSISIDAFSIHPYHWSFELTTQKISETKYLLRYAMGSMCFINCECAELTIPKAQQGKVYAVFDLPPYADGIYYSKYSTFLANKYYDAKKKIFAIGNTKADHCRCVEFASGQYALISDLGELLAIYVQIEH